MKKGMIVILFVGILLVSPLIQAQEQAQTYSGFNRFTNNVRMFFSSGDNKVRLALEIREREIDSAMENSQNQDEEDAIKNLERAHKKLKVVQEKVSLDTADEVEESVDELIDIIEDEEGLSDNFDVYVLEEKKTQLMAGLTKEIFEMCKKLAKEDYTAMLKEEKCNPETAPESLQKELKELKKLQEELFIQLMLDIRSCMGDPGTCNCDDVSDVDEKAQCKKMIALAVRCEYKDDQEACDQMIALRPPAESFVPDFLMNLFREKQEDMLSFHGGKSDQIPPECQNQNTKPECRQYDHLKETSAKCWDAEGNWDEVECSGPKDEVMTMQEAIPHCYDGDIFLEEKCGEITMVENEDGLINYIIENEINGIIDGFENETIDVGGEVIEDFVLVDEVWTIEEGIKDIDTDIQNWVVDHPAMDVDGDDGLTWDIKIDVDGDDVDNGDDDLGGVDPGPQGIVGDTGDDGDITPEVGGIEPEPDTSGTSTDGDDAEEPDEPEVVDED